MRRVSDHTLQQLIQAVYSAVLETGRWHSLLDSLSHEVGGHRATLQLRVPSPDHPGVIYMTNTDEASIEEYPRHLLDFPELVRSVATLPVGTAATAEELVGEDSLRRSAFFNEWARPLGDRSALFCKARQKGAKAALLGLAHPAPGSEFSPEGVQLVKALLPHIGTAVEILEHIEWVELQRRTAESGLDQLAVGVIFVDSQARLVHANSLGEELLRAGAGLRQVRGVVTAEQPAESRVLARMIATAADTANGAGSSAGSSVAVSRSDEYPSLTVSIVPLARDVASVWHDQRPEVALFVTDPSREPLGFVARLAARFGLTPRQAQLTAALVRGLSIEAAADLLQLRIGTARNYLKEVFLRTGTSRQGELIALVLRTVPPLDRD